MDTININTQMKAHKVQHQHDVKMHKNN